MIKEFVKLPIVIEAVQFTATSDNLVELSAFVTQRKLHFDPQAKQLIIETLEGDHIANLYDWIIKGVQGECYPCKPAIFQQNYEEVKEVM